MTRDKPYVGKTAYSGEVAANYDRDRVHEPIWQQEQAWMTEWARCIPAGARLLDLPAGTGRFLEIWRSRGARVHAVDISEDMLAELRRRCPANGADLVIERADAEELPYAAESFDFVVCWRLLHLLPPEVAGRVLREVARVCRGRIVVEVFNVASGGRLRSAARTAKLKLRRWLGQQPPLDPQCPNTPWAHITSYSHSEPALRAAFVAAGLDVETIYTFDPAASFPTRVYFLTRTDRPGISRDR